MLAIIGFCLIVIGALAFLQSGIMLVLSLLGSASNKMIPESRRIEGFEHHEAANQSFARHRLISIAVSGLAAGIGWLLLQFA